MSSGGAGAGDVCVFVYIYMRTVSNIVKKIHLTIGLPVNTSK